MATKLTTFKQQITINASCEELYSQIMDAKKHSALTGSEAIINNKVGSDFSVYGEYAYGKNTELVAGKRIVQTWRAHEDKWPEDCMSEIIFEFKKIDNTKSKIIFTHKNIPTAVAEQFKKGWIDYYWNPMRKKFNK